MKPLDIVMISLLVGLITFPVGAMAKGDQVGATTEALREVIVSHTDKNGILQLYCIKEDGSNSRQITHSEHGCRMPNCSPDGKQLVYVEQVGHGLSLRISDLDGRNARTLGDEGRNLMPSWLPDSQHIVWMRVKPQPIQDPARNSEITGIRCNLKAFTRSSMQQTTVT